MQGSGEERAYENILVERDGPVAVIRLNRPRALNALNSALMTELVTVLEEFDADEAIRCTVLTGNERAFAAGADIKEMAGATAVDMLQRFGQWERIRKLR